MRQAIWLRYIALMEGVSWLVLLFVAMPIKYLGHNPLPVKFAGMTHGMLFIILVILLMGVLQQRLISKKMGTALFIASLIPFGAFLIDSRYKAALATTPE